MFWDEPEAEISAQWYAGVVLGVSTHRVERADHNHKTLRVNAFLHEVKFRGEETTLMLDLLGSPEVQVGARQWLTVICWLCCALSSLSSLMSTATPL